MNNKESIGGSVIIAMILSLVGSACALGYLGFGCVCFFWAAFFFVGGCLVAKDSK